MLEEKVFQALKHVAYKSFVSEQAGGQAGELGISGKRVDELARASSSEDITLEELRRYGLLRGEEELSAPPKEKECEK